MRNSFSRFVYRRLTEDGEDVTGLTPADLGMHEKPGSGPDMESEGKTERLVDLAKTAAEKHPDAVMEMLEKLAQQDGEIKSGLESLRGADGGKPKFGREKGLGHMQGGDDWKDEVSPSFADTAFGGE